MTKNCVYFILCSSDKVQKGGTCHPLKIRLKEHRKAVVRGRIEKSDMADHIWKEKGTHLPLCDKVKEVTHVERKKERKKKNVL